MRASSLAVIVQGRVISPRVRPGREDRGPEVHDVDEEDDPEQPVDDGRHAREVADGQPDEPGQPSLAGVFVEVDGGEHAERDGQKGGDERHQEGAEDGREDAALGHAPAGRLG